jgi:hypothetical protein
MMISHKHVRALVSAFLLALAIASVPAGFAHAKIHQSRSSCEGSGYLWSDEFGCMDQTCEHNGVHYWPGDIRYGTGLYGLRIRYACNGFTGEWVTFRVAQPQVPTAPRPTTNGR